MSDEILYTVPEVAKILKCSRNVVYELVNTGVLPCLKVGRIKVEKKTLLEFLKRYEGYDVTNTSHIRPLEKRIAK